MWSSVASGLFSICTGSYAIPNTYCRVDAVFTNKAPGGVAYRCSLRVTEAIYLIERMMDVLAQKVGVDPDWIAPGVVRSARDTN